MDYKLVEPKRCNCWVWARRQYNRYGGYIAYRKSRFSPWIKHRLWSPNLTDWWSYQARSNKPHGWWFEALWFRGEIRKGDD